MPGETVPSDVPQTMRACRPGPFHSTGPLALLYLIWGGMTRAKWDSYARSPRIGPDAKSLRIGVSVAHVLGQQDRRVLAQGLAGHGNHTPRVD